MRRRAAVRSTATGRRRLPFAVVPLVLTLAACGSRAAEPAAADERIAECDAYVATLAKCMAPAGGALKTAAEQHTKALEGQFAQAAREPGARNRARVRCIEGTQYLAGACR